MKRLKWFLPALALTLLFNASAIAADMKIGYVGLLRAMHESTEGMATKESLKNEATRREAEVMAKRDELLKLKEEIDEKRSIWNQETLKAKVQVFQMKDEELVRFADRHTQEFNEFKQNKERRIEDELREIVRKIAKKKGYTHVFDITLNVLLVMPDGDDITDDVIKAYNKTKEK